MNSIIPGDVQDRCYICGRRGKMEVHHMLHGSMRSNAERCGLKVHLCRQCHANLHDHGAHDAELEEIAQAEFEKNHTRAQWMWIFGKNYRKEERE